MKIAGRYADRLAAYLKPPGKLLARVRWIFWLVGLFAAAITTLSVLDSTRALPLRMAALAGLLWLCWSWVRVYGHGEPSLAWDLTEGLAVFAVGVGAFEPLAALGVIYNGLIFRSLYGDTRKVAVRIAIYLGALLAAVAVSVSLFGADLALEKLLPQAVGFVALAAVFYVLGRTLGKSEQALEREQVLRRAGAELVASRNRESVYATAVNAALDLTSGYRNARTSLSVGTAERMVTVAAAGERAHELVDKQLDSYLLPEHYRQRFLAKDFVEVDRDESGELRASLGMTPNSRPFLMVPLFIEDQLSGALTAASESTFSQETKDGLEALSFQVALALESVAFAEDRHWRQSQVRFRSLIQNSSDLVLITDPDGAIEYVSPAVERVLGYDPKDLIGESSFTVVHPEDVVQIRNFHAKSAAAPGIRQAIEVRLRHLDGSWRYFETISNNLLDDPDVRGIVLNSRDITERKRAEEKQEKSEAQLAEAQRVARIGSWEMDIPTNTIIWSDELHRICGLEPRPQESTPFETFAELIHPDDAEFVRGMIEKAFQDHEPFAYDHRLIRPDGEMRMLHIQGEVFVDEADVPVRIVGTVQDVTERRQAEEESRLLRTVALEMGGSENLDSALRVALQRVCKSTDWIIGQAWVPDYDGTVLKCSPAWYTEANSLGGFRMANEDLTFEPGEGLAGRAWSTKQPVWTRNLAQSDFPRAPLGEEFGLRAGMTVPVLAGSEVVAVLDFFVFEQREEDERLVELVSGVASQLGSVIQRKQAEDALRESEANLTEAQQVAHLGSWSVEPLKPGMPQGKREMRWSDEMYRIFGFAPQEFVPTSESPINSIHPQDKEYVRRALEDSKSRGEPSLTIEHRVIRPDGEVRFVQAQMETIFDENSELFRRFGTVLDITDRKQAEEALRSSEALNRAIVDTAYDAIITMSGDGLIRSFNRAAEDIFGYSSEEVVGRPLRMLMPERFRVQHEASFRRYLETGEAHIIGKAPVELAGLRKDGTEFPLELSLGEMREGEELLFTGVVRDITERKRIEDTLRASEASLAEAQRIASLGSWETDLITGEMRWSEEMYRIFGFTLGEVAPTREILTKATHPQDREIVPESIRNAVEKRRPFSVEHRVLRPDGEIRIVQARGEAVFDSSGRPIRIAGTSLDITERKQVEEEVRRSESRLLAAQRIARVGDWSFDVVDNKAHWSDEMYRIFGLDPQGPVLTYKGFLRLVHPDDRATVREMSREALNGGSRSSIDYRVIRPDSEVRFVHSQYEVRRDASDKTTELAGTLQDVTELRQAEAELREQAEIIDLAPVLIRNLNNEIILWNAGSERMYGWSEEEAVGRISHELLESEHPEPMEEIRAKILREGRWEGEIVHTRKDGRRVVVASLQVLHRDERGEASAILEVNNDVTERRRVQDELRRSDERFRSLVQNSLDVILVVDATATIVYYSPSAETVMGHKPGEFVGKNALEAVPIHPDDLPHVRDVFSYLVENSGVNYSMEMRMLHADGSWRVIEATANNLLDNPSVGGIVTNYRDITERKAFEEQLEHQAFHDDLTGLPNRALFMDRLEHAMSRIDRQSGCVAVLFLDLDNFKVVNDSLGHQMGDELLAVAAQRLRGCVRPADTVARLSGDEFIVLLEDIKEKREATRLAERLVGRLRDPFEIGGRSLHLTVSVGIAFGASGDDHPDDLLRNADIAMYRAKRRGKAHYRVFDAHMDAEARERLRLETELRQAIEREELRVYYQPKVLLETGEIFDFEALVRWEHPQRGLVLPSEFIPIAEETGMIHQLGWWVLREACRQTCEWQEQRPNETPTIMCVNLSAKQFQHQDLAQNVAQILQETGLDPNSLCLEITESVAMEEVQSTIATLNKLTDLGIKLAIDDFGTGYSSLSYLKNFPVDYLKIDRSIVSGLERDNRNRAIVLSTITLAHALNLRVVAEGVETAEECATLRALECDIGQGYYFARPLPARDIPTLL